MIPFYTYVLVILGLFAISFVVGLIVGPRLKEQNYVWLTFVYQNEVHTIPKNDTMAHMLTYCECEPRVVPIQKDDGDWMYRMVHYAQDGRKQCK